MMADVYRIQFYYGRSLALRQNLEDRSEEGSRLSSSDIAKRDLERYYDLLALSMPLLSEAEAWLLVDTMNGVIITIHTAQTLWASVDDAILDGLDRKHGVDGLAFVKRLRAMTLCERMALCDAIEQFWAGPYTKTSEEARAMLRRVFRLKEENHASVRFVPLSGV